MVGTSPQPKGETMSGVTEIKAGELKKGDMFDLVYEVISVRRSSKTGTPMVNVKCNVIDRRYGSVKVANDTKSFFEWETVLREDVAA